MGATPQEETRASLEGSFIGGAPWEEGASRRAAGGRVRKMCGQKFFGGSRLLRILLGRMDGGRDDEASVLSYRDYTL